jgi:CRP-like cAMP-binding protein
MISPELLRRYPFFAPFNESQLQSIAMLSEEVHIDAGVTLFEECHPANTFFILLEGAVDLYYKSEEQYHPKTKKEFSVGEINPGEIVAVSALIEPFTLNATGKTAKPSRLVKIEAQELRKMMNEDPQLGYITMHQVAKAIMERLAFTRVQLAAAWA